MDVYKANQNIKYGFIKAKLHQFIIISHEKAQILEADLKHKVTKVGSIPYTGSSYLVLDYKELVQFVQKVDALTTYKLFQLKDIMRRLDIKSLVKGGANNGK